ncbi:MAG: OmpH family outer membrane protein [Gammaproteobacteria bacterium]|nr:OmpH family outer membrane protein [Gammaproteobacteria bacterium]
MKSAMKIFLPMAVMVFLTHIASVSAAELKIGVVDRQVLLQQSPQAQHAQKLMHEKFDGRFKAMQSEQDRIKKLQDQINRNGTVMSADQLQALENQLDSMQQEFRRKQDDFQSDVNTQRNQIISELQADIDKAAQEFAKTQNFNLILDKNFSVYADGSIDVTNQVLNQMQKDYKSQSGKQGSG